MDCCCVQDFLDVKKVCMAPTLDFDLNEYVAMGGGGSDVVGVTNDVSGSEYDNAIIHRFESVINMSFQRVPCDEWTFFCKVVASMVLRKERLLAFKLKCVRSSLQQFICTNGFYYLYTGGLL